MITQNILRSKVKIPVGFSTFLGGELIVPVGAKGIVVFAHGSGSSRNSPRNRFVASVINNAGLATLLFDLLTEEEETIDVRTRHFRFDIVLLAQRLVLAVYWLAEKEATGDLRVGLFGASTGGAAALMAAGELGERVGAVVSRGGRPDLAGASLARVRCPVLLIVGELDETVIRLNEEAFVQMQCERELKIVDGATHLFEEPGALENVAELAVDWFERYLQPLVSNGAKTNVISRELI